MKEVQSIETKRMHLGRHLQPIAIFHVSDRAKLLWRKAQYIKEKWQVKTSAKFTFAANI